MAGDYYRAGMGQNIKKQFWIGVRLGFMVISLYIAVIAWRDAYVVSSEERLLRIGLMLAFGYVGGECWKRAKS